LSPLFKLASRYAIRKVQENQERLKLNGTHQLLAWVQDVNPLGGNINRPTIRKDKTLLSRGIVSRLKINAQETIHVSYHIVRQNYNIKII
jgi:hypothetical protein